MKIVNVFRGGCRAAATSKMERFDGWKLLTIITKYSILDVTAALDPPLLINNITFALILLNLELTN